MDRLTEHLSNALQSEPTEWKKLKVEKRKERAYSDEIVWSIGSVDEEQTIEKVLVRFEETGPIAAEFVPPIPVIEASDISPLAWSFLAVEFCGSEVDDINIVLTPAGYTNSLHKKVRYSKRDFLNFWPHLQKKVDDAHNISLLFRVEIVKFLRAQILT